MDASALRAAYAEFLDVARYRRGAVAPDGQWSPELVLAHLIVGDRLIAEAAARVLAGGQPRFDNRASQSAPYLEAVVSAAGSWDALVEGVRLGGEELAATVERIGPDHARTEVPAFIMDGDRVLVDGPVPLERLVMAPAAVHLRGHAEQVQSYERGTRESDPGETAQAAPAASPPPGPPSVSFELDTFALLLLRPGSRAAELDDGAVRRLQAEHVRYLFGLQSAGSLLAAGATAEGFAQQTLTGLGFFRTSREVTLQLAQADPSVRAGLDAAEVLTFMCPKGAISFPGAREGG
ncbi:MAG TPA: hypothetical protein VKF59_11070 [Candidatus Dormibacteraeota bacterium]|nr:hypothetical protein [Candidatus Dormibacteraeota bacterium]